MVWLGIILLMLIGILCLPIKMQLTLDYGEGGFYGIIQLFIWKKAVLRKQYDVAALLAKKTAPKAGTSGKGKVKAKIGEMVKAEILSIISIAVKNIFVEKWSLSGNLGLDFPGVKGVFYGIISGVTWWFYGASRQWLVWKKAPVLNLGFSPAEINWQFQCMISAPMGQIIGKGMKIAVLFIRRGIKNGAKERNRSAHANGYL